MGKARSIWWAVPLLALLSSGTAWGEDLNAAREHYKRGTMLYDLQRFEEAAKEYELAFENKPDPVLLFNIAQAYRYAGDNKKALGAYRAYMRENPRAQNRTEVAERIADLQRILDAQQKSQLAPPMGIVHPGEQEPRPEAHASAKPTAKPAQAATPPETEKPETPAATTPEAAPPEVAAKPKAPSTPSTDHAVDEAHGRTKLYAGVAVAVVGVALIGVGGGMAAMAQSAEDEINHPKQDWVFDPSVQDHAKLYQSLEYSFIGIGAAAVVAGGVVAILGARQRSAARHASIAPLVGPRQAGALVNVHF